MSHWLSSVCLWLSYWFAQLSFKLDSKRSKVQLEDVFPHQTDETAGQILPMVEITPEARAMLVDPYKSLRRRQQTAEETPLVGSIEARFGRKW